MKYSILLSALFLFLYSGAEAQKFVTQTSGTSRQLYSVSFVNSDTGWAVGDSAAIVKTTNGGVTWVSQTGKLNLHYVQFINVDTGWAVGGLTGTGGIVMRTTDGGAHWVTQDSGTSLGILWAAFFVNGKTGWTVGSGGTIRKTTNGGVSWVAETSGVSSRVMSGVFFRDTANGWVTGDSGTILKTANGGATWTAQSSGTTKMIHTLRMVSVDTGWAVGSSGTILKTTNGGAAWTSQTSGITTGDLWSIAAFNSTSAWIAGNPGIILRTIDGTAWSSISTNDTVTGLFGINFVNTNYGWVVGANGKILKFISPFPLNLKYAKNPAGYAPGVLITPNVPTLTGDTPMTYSVTPALPTGLTLNASTGAISGTPASASAAANYTVTATNSFGSTTVALNLTVIAPPTGLSYPQISLDYTAGTLIASNIPTVSGVVTNYSVSPALPAGIVISATSGVISGTPTAASATTTYTITASNAGGSTTTFLSITVSSKPLNLAYTANPVVYTVNTLATPDTLNLAGTAPLTFAIAPALPAGLVFSTVNGRITGTPTAVTAAANYTVTVTNSLGSGTVVLNLRVAAATGIFGAGSHSNFALRFGKASALFFDVPTNGVASAKLTILDAKGAAIWSGVEKNGNGFDWNGTARQGRAVSAGSYLARLQVFNSAHEVVGESTRAFSYNP